MPRTPDPAIIEAMAEAMYEGEAPDQPMIGYEGLHELDQEPYIRMARAAYEALQSAHENEVREAVAAERACAEHRSWSDG